MNDSSNDSEMSDNISIHHSNNEMDNESTDDFIHSDQGSDSESEEQTSSNITRKRVFIPGQKLPKGTQLVPDESAYIMRHEFGLDSPSCYSFDFIRKGCRQGLLTPILIPLNLIISL